MKVRITKGRGWYEDRVGEIFEVSPIIMNVSGGDYYDVINSRGRIIRCKCCEPLKEKYTYADVDLPSWWDGRPIKGYAWDDGDKHLVWCISVRPQNEEPFLVEYKNCVTIFKHFEPTTSTPTKVTIEKDGVKHETVLTAEQVEALGL